MRMRQAPASGPRLTALTLRWASSTIDTKAGGMRAMVDKKLFWFLHDGTSLDLSDCRNLDMVVQQTVVRGQTVDIRRLVVLAGLPALAASLGRIRGFLPAEVRAFWEEYLGNSDRDSA